MFSGKNEQLAWGSSFSFIDDQDLYFEKLNPDNKEEYLSSIGVKRFSTQKKLIKVKNNACQVLSQADRKSCYNSSSTL